jgi:hypothetical protein
MSFSEMSETRYRTEHVAALAVHVPIARTVQVVRGKDGRLLLDIETHAMQPGTTYTFNLGDQISNG